MNFVRVKGYSWMAGHPPHNSAKSQKIHSKSKILLCDETFRVFLMHFHSASHRHSFSCSSRCFLRTSCPALHYHTRISYPFYVRNYPRKLAGFLLLTLCCRKMQYCQTSLSALFAVVW